MIYLPSFLLSVILTETVLSVYDPLLPLKMLFPVLIICLVSFAALIFTDRHRLRGTLLMITYIFAVFFMIGLFSRAGMLTTDIYFWQWVLTSGDEAASNLYYIFALTLGAGVFFSVTIYYFSTVLYRISFLTLVCLMPCVLYAKVMADIENLYLILISGSLLLLHIYHARHEEEIALRNTKGLYPEGFIKDLRLNAFIPALFFVLFVLLITALIPKKEEARYYDRFEDLFLGGDTTSELSQDFSSMSEFSGNADNYNSLSNRRIYTLYGDGYAYLRRQTYDYYDPEEDRWYNDKDALKLVCTPESRSKMQRAMQPGNLQAAIKKMCDNVPGFAQRYGLENFLKQEITPDPERSLYVRSENFRAVYYLSPSRAIEVIPSSEGAGHGVTRSGLFLRKEGSHDPDFSYRLNFYDQNTSVPSWVETGITDISGNGCLNMLTEMAEYYGNLAGAEKESECLDSFLAEQKNALDLKKRTAKDTEAVPDRIKELSKELTSGYKNDYYKAAALVRYFHNGDFTYDSDYIPPDHGVSYFLFESRRGSCSDFATAFTLLARSAGLTVRYAEGFLPEITTRENYYTISERDSHAFPEVFIPNTGWIVFEPTIGGVATQFELQDPGILELIDSLRVDYGLAFFITVIIAALVILYVFIRILIPGIGELVFRICLNFMSTDTIVIKAYERLRKKYGTPCLTPSEFNSFLKEKGHGIPLISSSYESLVYGGISPKTGKSFKHRLIKEYSLLQIKQLGS